jgi:glucose/arabinose dehydrogenase
MPRPLFIAGIVALLGVASAPSAQSVAFPNAYGLTPAVPDANFGDMVDFAMIPGSNDEAIVIRKDAEEIHRVSVSDAFAPTLYGDLSDYVGGGGGEEGLLSAAFSPDFANDGRIYVYYTQGAPNETVLSRFQVSAGAMITDGPGAETRILEIPDFAGNHNGGRIVFGQDGYLYLSLGDGGGGGDPEERGQDLESWLGKVLRINVTGITVPPYYTIPLTNPFVGIPGRDEIFAYGFRNPWRMSRDRDTGTMWIADVGQNKWEEVQSVVSGGNYGWDCYEGFESFEPAGCPGGGFIFPRAVYDHSLGCAVVGGYVYRGTAMPELDGWYVYGDNCSGRIFAVDATPGSTTPAVQLDDTSHQISSFAELPDGELLVLTFSNAIFRLHNDGDGDGLPAHQDNCPEVANASQTETDGDFRGEDCETSGTGNVNCDGGINSVDALTILRHVVALTAFQMEPCINLNVPRALAPPDNRLMGDVDCSGAVNSIDALRILRDVAGLPVTLPGGCPPIDP